MQRQTKVPLATAAASGLICFAIDRYWFDCPFGNWHQPMRDWGLHWIALVCAVMTTWLLLQKVSDGSRGSLSRARHISLWIPLLVASLHEGGQWLWPAGDRDSMDNGRDFVLNLVGTVVAWRILARWCPLPEVAARMPRQGASRAVGPTQEPQ